MNAKLLLLAVPTSLFAIFQFAPSLTVAISEHLPMIPFYGLMILGILFASMAVAGVWYYVTGDFRPQ